MLESVLRNIPSSGKRSGHKQPLTGGKASSNGWSKTRESSKKGKFGKKERGRVMTSRLLMMASAVWWCYNLDNCVKVNAVDQICPPDCDCYDEFKEVYCEARALRSIPSEIPFSVNSLSLGNNNIRELQRNSFRQIPGLETLRLNGNHIRDIPRNAFYGLKKLRRLDLSTNRLTHIPTEAMAQLVSIQEISLRGNPITEIVGYEFIQIRATLRSLDVGELRHLKYLSNQALAGLDNLQALSMDSCGLNDMPTVRPLTNIRTLNLANNRISVLDSNSLKGLRKLSNFHMEYGALATVANDAFNDLVSLEILNLSGNNLTSLPPTVFRYTTRLTSLKLQRNPWLCNCDLLPLAGFLSDSTACTDGLCGTCRYPPTYRGLPLANLTRINNPPCAALIIGEQTSPSLNVSVGDSVRIPCPTLPPNHRTSKERIKWKTPNGTSIRHGQYKVRITMLGNGSLNFTKVTLKDKGLYTCSVSKSGNEVAKSTVFLNVTSQTNVLTPSYFATETSVSKATRNNVQYQNPRPTQPAFVPKPTTAQNSVAVQWKPTTRKSNPFIPILSKPESPASTTPYYKQKEIQQDSMNEVMRTTKIIIGCFVGLTLVAAIILLAFYKLRKKNFSQRREPYESSGRGGPRTNCAEANLIDRQLTNDIARQRIEEPMNHINNSTPIMTSPTESMWMMTSQSNNNQNILLPQTAVHVLPPPPEEMFPHNNTTISSMTSQNTSVTSSLCYPTLRKKPTATPSVPSKQLLSSLATSCRQVALERRSDGYKLGSEVSGPHKSCNDLKRAYDGFPPLEDDVSRMSDIDFATAGETNIEPTGHAQVRPQCCTTTEKNPNKDAEFGSTAGPQRNRDIIHKVGSVNHLSRQPCVACLRNYGVKGTPLTKN
ncbi:leucine-rich repeat-containing protein 4-like isoform X2 [Ciona intestinalis]